MNPEASNSNPVDVLPPSAVSTPTELGIQISNVNSSLWQYIKKRRLWELLLVVPFVVIWEVLIVILFVKYLGVSSGTNSQNGQIFGYLIAAPFIVFGSWLYRLRKQFEAAFLEEFALANKYSFDKNGTVDETYGSIFRLTGRQSVSDVVTGAYNSSLLRLFLYELVIGSGRYQQRYQDTVIELDLHGQLPNLLMVNKHSRFRQLNLAGAFGIKNTIELEGDFNQYFNLYAPRGNEMEALEVFSPDTMALMEDESKHYTVEFAGNRIYIYCSGFIATTENLTQLFALAKKLIEKIAPLASRLKNDSTIAATPVNIIKTRKTHPFARKLGVVTTVVLLIIGLGLMMLAIRNEPEESATSTSSLSSPNSAFPYCGVVPNSSMPPYTQQYAILLIAQNKQLDSISTEIKVANYTVSNAVIQQLVAVNQQYITSLKTINFPSNAQSAVTNEINAIQNYDALITQEETTTVSNSALDNARDTQSTAAKQLHYVLGLAPSTCGFYEP